MKQFFKNFFSTSNEINENTVMGVVFSVALLASIIPPLQIPIESQVILIGAVGGFFGLNLGKNNKL